MFVEAVIAEQSSDMGPISGGMDLDQISTVLLQYK
jgi:hypothetical protein